MKQWSARISTFLVKYGAAFAIAGLTFALSSSPSAAACTPFNAGDGSDNTITCDDVNNPSGADVSGGNGADTININAGAAAGDVDGGRDPDIINLNGGSAGNITGGGGADTFNLTSGVAASASGDGGADTITLGGATISGAISAGDSDDIIDLLSGSAASVDGGNGKDQIRLEGTATITGAISGGADQDTIDLLSGSAGSVSGGDAKDLIRLEGTAVISGTIFGDDGNDTINLLSGQAAAVDGGGAADTITLDGATISGVITGDVGVDIIDLLGGSAGSVDGGSDEDHITLDGATISGTVTGSYGIDTIDLLGGSAGSVDGGSDADQITLDGATIFGELSGGGDDDVIDLLAGSAGSVSGGTGVDTITLDGATIEGAIKGDDGDDIITLYSGTAASVSGNSGADTIVLDGATVTGLINGNTGDDSISLVSGSAASVEGRAGADTVDIDSASFDLTGMVLDGGTDDLPDNSVDVLNFNDAWSGTLTGADIRGFERIAVNGGTVAFSDELVATGSGSGLGLFVLDGGSLDASVGLAVTGDLTIGATSTLLAGGATPIIVSVSGDLANSGTIDMQGNGNVAGDRVAVSGDYAADASATLKQDIDLSTGAGDMLDVAGSISGSTDVDFAISGLGNIASDIVFARAGADMNGTFDSDQLPKASGLATYAIVQDGEGNWVVRSSLDANIAGSSIGLYADTVVAVLSAFGAFPDLAHRDRASRDDSACHTTPWLGGDAARLRLSTTGQATGAGTDTGYGGSIEMDIAGFRAGVDCTVQDLGGEGIDVFFGATGGYLKATSRNASDSGMDIEALSFGVYSGIAVDQWTVALRYRHDDFDVDAVDAAIFGKSQRQSFSGTSDALDLSAAYDFTVARDVILTPEIGLGYSRTGFSSFSATAGNVDIHTVNQVTADADLTATWALPGAPSGVRYSVYGSVGVSAMLAGGTTTVLNAAAGDVTLVSDSRDATGRVALGVTFANRSTGMSGYLDAKAWSGDGIDGVGVFGGVKLAF